MLTTIAIIGILAFNTTKFFSVDGVTLQKFFLTTEWSPREAQHFGVWPLICGTLLVTAVAMIVALPLGLVTAIFLSEYAPRKLRAVLKPTLEILAGIPTVVYGFFALTFITPHILQAIDPEFDLFNACGAGIAVGILCLPIVTSLTEDALQAVPRSLRDAGYGLGATRFEVSLYDRGAGGLIGNHLRLSVGGGPCGGGNDDRHARGGFVAAFDVGHPRSGRNHHRLHGADFRGGHRAHGRGLLFLVRGGGDLVRDDVRTDRPGANRPPALPGGLSMTMKPAILTDPKRRQQAMRPINGRRLKNQVFVVFCAVTAFLSILVLAVLAGDDFPAGVAAFELEFPAESRSSENPEDSGIKSSLIGTLVVCGLCAVMTLPLGVATAIFLREFQPRHQWAKRVQGFIELNINNLAGVPSVVYGILALTAFVQMFGVLGTPDSPVFEFGADYYYQYFNEGRYGVWVPVDSYDAPPPKLVSGICRPHAVGKVGRAERDFLRCPLAGG